ncbi:MAG: serine/threonine-protein kinase [Acidobacteria bacterium]|nr:serine/threonine-protein kinase [Acidobacteriota bacterium]
MTKEQWRTAWELFQSASDLPDAEQREYVERTTTDPVVVERVLLMLDEKEQISGPEVGQQIGRYRILAPLGKGGMGEVFSAQDTDLDRVVALKFLGQKVAGLPSAVGRLIREAKAASALNHPNIVTVYEVIRSDAGLAIVTELVEGVSLREKCNAPQPIEQVAAWGQQLARGLFAAHAAGIVHGDIKPENIMLRPDGVLKIVDFGLARRVLGDEAAGDLTMGTVGYMSPEQIRGEALTEASDIFSMGVVLYELATGIHPFAADSPSQTAKAIAAGARSRAAVRRGAPRQFDRLCGATLEPDPSARPSAASVAARLGEVAAPSPRRIAAWIIAGALAAACGAGFLLWNRPGTEHFAGRIVPFTNYEGSETEPAFSPDGTRVAFSWMRETAIHRDVYVKEVSGGDPVRVTPGDANYYSPAWSPDGRQIAVLRGVRGFAQEVLIVPAQGGEPRIVGRIADTQGFRRTVGWWPDGQTLLVRDATPQGIRLVRLSLSGTPPQPMTLPPRYQQDSVVTPSPDGTRIAFVRSGSQKVSVCLLPADGRPEDGSRDPCIHSVPSISGLAWQPDGRGLIYSDGSGLVRLTLDGGRVKRVTRLLEGTFGGLAADPRNQRLAFTRTLSDMNLWHMDRSTHKAQKFVSSSTEDSEPQFSPDGKKFVFRSQRTGAYELWVADRDGSHLVQITFTGGHLGSAQWSPDGNYIVFDGNRFTMGPHKGAQHTGIYVVSAAGGPLRRLTDDRTSAMVPSWSRDGHWIYYSSSDDGRVDLLKVPAEGGAPVKLSDGPVFEAIESVDQRSFYYTRLYRAEGIWRRLVAGGEGTVLPGTEGARDRHWEYHRDGIYFVDGASTLMLRFFSFATGRVTPVAPFPPHVAIGPRALTVSPDGTTVIYCQEDLTLSDVMLLEKDR